MAIKVIVADDHYLVRVGIVRMLEDVDGVDIIAEASSGESAIELACSLKPDVILMDIKMPGIGGIEATKKLVHLCESAKVVALTSLDDNPFPSRLLKAGALGYLTKGAELSEVVTAIKHAAAGKRYLSPSIAQQMALNSIDSNSSSPFNQLSERELQISMMVINCVKVQEISDKLCLSSKTVNSYRYRIFEKLNVNGDVELTRLAIRHGMLDPQDV